MPAVISSAPISVDIAIMDMERVEEYVTVEDWIFGSSDVGEFIVTTV